jgi:hypothetical protein
VGEDEGEGVTPSFHPHPHLSPQGRGVSLL